MTRPEPTLVRRVAIIGTGVIGRGWAAHFLRFGLEVIGYNPRAGAGAEIRQVMADLWPTMERLGLADGADLDRLSFTTDLKTAVAGADFVQENTPEDTALKSELYAAMDGAAPPHVVLASSTSGIPMTTLQQGCRHPERCIVGHPFVPPYLIPLVEVVGGRETDPEVVEWTVDFYEAMGKYPLKLDQEVLGFIGNRLLEALWREALHLVADGQATVEQIDATMAYAIGLRWAIFGPFLIYHLGGGEGGMAHFLDQFGPALKLPWTHMEAPELTPTLRQRLIDGCLNEAAGRSIRELERERDECLIGILKVLDECQGRGIL